MEKFLLHSAKIVGTPTQTSDSWVHVFSPSQPEKLSRRGHFLAVIGLKNFSGAGEIAVVGKEVISRLHEEYYGDLVSSPFDQLKKAVQKVADEAKGGTEFELDLGVVGVVNNVLYGVLNNGGKLVIAREGKVASLLAGNGVVSGYIQNEDVFLLGTGDFFKLVSQEAIQTALVDNSPEEAVEILAPLIHGQEDGGAAAVIFKVFNQADEKKAFYPEVSLTKKSKLLSSIGGKLKSQITYLGKTVVGKAKKKFFSLSLRKEKTPRSQKTLVSVALILLALLGISVFFGMKRRENLGLNQKTLALFEEAKLKKEEGEALISLNPAKSRQLLLEASQVIQKIEETGVKDEKFIKFKQELDGLLASVLQEHQVEGDLFFDLEIIKAGASGDDLSIAGDQMIILDKNKLAIYSLGIKDKKSRILAGGEKLKGAKLIAISSPKIYVLTEEGILEAERQELKISSDKEWEQIADFSSFDGNLYLLDRQGEIWKYSAGEEGFGAKQKWLKEKFDFSQAISMAIDGSIWVLQSNGSVMKFTRGIRDTFNFSGLNNPLFEPKAIYTEFDLENLYILDGANSRIVVFSKSGEYKAEYSWAGLSQTTDFVVAENESKIFLLNESKIYELGIK